MNTKDSGRDIRLFLCGDVMTGRGVDQILPHPNTPELYESYVRDARTYVELAERTNGAIPQPADFGYIWGEALGELERAAPHLRIVNLETAVTDEAEPWPRKGIHYRMHPANTPCLTAAGIDCCVLANNHAMDWGRAGLEQTLAALHAAGIATSGAGRNLEEAAAPAVLTVPGGSRVLVFAFGHGSSGIPPDWHAGRDRSGVNLLEDLSDRAVARIAASIRNAKTAQDIVVASIHWGANWGYEVPAEHRRFAHQLIEAAGVDVVHGHSSHHVKAIEVYGNRLILYGCGDLINDYEGISGEEGYRADLALMYFPSINPASGELMRLMMSPTRTARLCISRANARAAHWLQRLLSREGAPFGTTVSVDQAHRLSLSWRSP